MAETITGFVGGKGGAKEYLKLFSERVTKNGGVDREAEEIVKSGAAVPLVATNAAPRTIGSADAFRARMGLKANDARWSGLVGAMQSYGYFGDTELTASGQYVAHDLALLSNAFNADSSMDETIRTSVVDGLKSMGVDTNYLHNTTPVALLGVLSSLNNSKLINYGSSALTLDEALSVAAMVKSGAVIGFTGESGKPEFFRPENAQLFSAAIESYRLRGAGALVYSDAARKVQDRVNAVVSARKQRDAVRKSMADGKVTFAGMVSNGIATFKYNRAVAAAGEENGELFTEVTRNKQVASPDLLNGIMTSQFFNGMGNDKYFNGIQSFEQPLRAVSVLKAMEKERNVSFDWDNVSPAQLANAAKTGNYQDVLRALTSYSDKPLYYLVNTAARKMKMSGKPGLDGAEIAALAEETGAREDQIALVMNPAISDSALESLMSDTDLYYTLEASVAEDGDMFTTVNMIKDGMDEAELAKASKALLMLAGVVKNNAADRHLTGRVLTAAGVIKLRIEATKTGDKLDNPAAAIFAALVGAIDSGYVEQRPAEAIEYLAKVMRLNPAAAAHVNKEVVNAIKRFVLLSNPHNTTAREVLTWISFATDNKDEVIELIAGIWDEINKGTASEVNAEFAAMVKEKVTSADVRNVVENMKTEVVGDAVLFENTRGLIMEKLVAGDYFAIANMIGSGTARLPHQSAVRTLMTLERIVADNGADRDLLKRVLQAMVIIRFQVGASGIAPMLGKHINAVYARLAGSVDDKLMKKRPAEAIEFLASVLRANSAVASAVSEKNVAAIKSFIDFNVYDTTAREVLVSVHLAANNKDKAIELIADVADDINKGKSSKIDTAFAAMLRNRLTMKDMRAIVASMVTKSTEAELLANIFGLDAAGVALVNSNARINSESSAIALLSSEQQPVETRMEYVMDNSGEYAQSAAQTEGAYGKVIGGEIDAGASERVVAFSWDNVFKLMTENLEAMAATPSDAAIHSIPEEVLKTLLDSVYGIARPREQITGSLRQVLVAYDSAADLFNALGLEVVPEGAGYNEKVAEAYLLKCKALLEGLKAGEIALADGRMQLGMLSTIRDILMVRYNDESGTQLFEKVVEQIKTNDAGVVVPVEISLEGQLSDVTRLQRALYIFEAAEGYEKLAKEQIEKEIITAKFVKDFAANKLPELARARIEESLKEQAANPIAFAARVAAGVVPAVAVMPMRMATAMTRSRTPEPDRLFNDALEEIFDAERVTSNDKKAINMLKAIKVKSAA